MHFADLSDPQGFKEGEGRDRCCTGQHRAEHCFTYLPYQPVPWGHQIKIWGDLGSSSLSSSIHQHPLTWGVVDKGEDKPGFSVSCLCWLLSAREITSKGLCNFLSHPWKREREQRISPAPPLQSHWAVDLPFLTGKAVCNLVVRKSLESSV